MRRGEYFPIYRPSQLGGQRTKPFTRPVHDSLPHFECGTAWCGEAMRQETSVAPFVLFVNGSALRFCSWGCLGRYSALQEIRS